MSGPIPLPSAAAAGIPAPAYDRSSLLPAIVHIGVGGFCRAHLADYTDAVAGLGLSDWGIVGLGLLPGDAAMAHALTGQDFLYTLVEKGPGAPRATVIGSLVGYVHAPPEAARRAADLIAAPTTRILSLTITEAGYVEPAAPGARTSFDSIADGLALRRATGGGPLTVLSCDNIPHNGAVARDATLAAAGRLDAELPGWVQEHCSFPSSMVDRITPVTSAADREWVRDVLGVDDAWPVVAEPFRQWVLEDDFAAGRPAWERDGAIFTDRVADWELYKLRLLNAGHSSMAYLSALAGLVHVDEAMRVAPVRAFVSRLLFEEAAPTVKPIDGHPPAAYVASVLERFENPGIGDQIARLCIDGTAKFPTFLIPTVRRQLDVGGPLECAATALAGWARYLGTVARADQAFDASGDAAVAHGVRASADPASFLDFAAVFPSEVRDAPEFAAAFVEAYDRIRDEGPLAAMAAASARTEAR